MVSQRGVATEMVYLKVYTPGIKFEAVAVLEEVAVMVATLGVVPTWVQVPLLPAFPVRFTVVMASQ